MDSTSICRLCLKRRKLCNSHIFPEFFYEPMYDAKHRIHSVPANPEERIQWEQKGLREYLLCIECDNQLSRYEVYAKPLFDKGNIGRQPRVVENTMHHVLIENVNYKLFKLFQLSLLWRAGVASRQEFSTVNLGPYHEKKLRTMLQQENPGKPHEYGCLLMAVLHEGKHMDMVSSPGKGRFNNHTCYRFMAYGFLWVYVVSSHSAQFPHAEAFLQDDGKFMFLWGEAKNMPFLVEYAYVFSKRKDDMTSFLR